MQQWGPWRDRFVAINGRVVDNVNNSISHSEGQGYGMLLAVLAEDRETFVRIWTFTQNELLIRDDGLAAWRWEPDRKPHVTDINDAADGDILIAYSLALASELWRVPVWHDAARTIAVSIGQNLVRRDDGYPVLMPGSQGFGAKDRIDGPVVNLSYWVFEAMPVLAQLDPKTDWEGLSRQGQDLIRRARFSPDQLPADWISLKTAEPAPAAGFEPRFSYDAIRIPLYLLRANITDRTLLEPFAQSWAKAGGIPAIVRFADANALEPLIEPGYRMIAASVKCALDHSPIPPELRDPEPRQYYPATLYLLAASALAQHYPGCL
ncbi:endoglucanase [Methylovirgula sp. 4M-Z18]|nr:endoglucanase [Methylovirgula sp. 4M-Z18]